METQFNIEEHGFITQFLVCGLKERTFAQGREQLMQPETERPEAGQQKACQPGNQLAYEAALRAQLPARAVLWQGGIGPGKTGPEGLPWTYYYSHGDWFVDFSKFYSTLTKVELSAATILEAGAAVRAEAVLWSYGAVTVWCNGEVCGEIQTPVYKPMVKKNIILPLKKGTNNIYLKLQNLGVRDTRTIVGLQLLSHTDSLKQRVPGGPAAEACAALGSWLSEIRKEDEMLVFSGPAPAGAKAFFGPSTQEPGKEQQEMIGGLSALALKPGFSRLSITVPAGDTQLFRHFEDIRGHQPQFRRYEHVQHNQQLTYEEIAGHKGPVRDGAFFGMANILARKAVGRERPDDRQNLRDCLIPVRQRFDCSDFILSALFRYLENYPVDDELAEEIRQTVTGYRFWMDQQGADGMCFWSENHALLFYGCAMLAGRRYPDEWFFRAQKTGTELYRFGRERIKQWLACAGQDGFEEFLSSGYMAVTFAGLLNIIDYGEKEIAGLAAQVADRLLRMLALQSFKGTLIAPMGRVYRGVLFPYEQPVQMLLNLFNPDAPYAAEQGEGWMAFYATSSYQPPEDFVRLMNTPAECTYSTGNALVAVNKNRDCCMTSIQSGRTDGVCRWPNLTLEANVSPDSHAYTRSLNERFHGTTCIQPGVYGYQQHLWYAALAPDTFTFSSHPGGTCEATGMRPGYWYGNGVMPALKQDHFRLGVIYFIPDSHPIHFTHLFWPDQKFDEMQRHGQWLFGRKDGGFLAVWASGPLIPFGEWLFDCEYRLYGDQSAYFCVCGDRQQGSFEEFIARCQAMEPKYRADTKELWTRDGFWLKYQEGQDQTQIIL